MLGMAFPIVQSDLAEILSKACAGFWHESIPFWHLGDHGSYGPSCRLAASLGRHRWVTS